MWPSGPPSDAWHIAYCTSERGLEPPRRPRFPPPGVAARARAGRRLRRGAAPVSPSKPRTPARGDRVALCVARSRCSWSPSSPARASGRRTCSYFAPGRGDADQPPSLIRGAVSALRGQLSADRVDSSCSKVTLLSGARAGRRVQVALEGRSLSWKAFGILGVAHRETRGLEQRPHAHAPPRELCPRRGDVLRIEGQLRPPGIRLRRSERRGSRPRRAR